MAHIIAYTCVMLENINYFNRKSGLKQLYRGTMERTFFYVSTILTYSICKYYIVMKYITIPYKYII